MDKKDLATWFTSLSKEEKEVVKLRFGIGRLIKSF
jgi:DNA-directed RNA polymerase sigma subunit (sigma70/sigma32)